MSSYRFNFKTHSCLNLFFLTFDDELHRCFFHQVMLYMPLHASCSFTRWRSGTADRSESTMSTVYYNERSCRGGGIQKITIKCDIIVETLLACSFQQHNKWGHWLENVCWHPENHDSFYSLFSPSWKAPVDTISSIEIIKKYCYPNT